MELLNLNKYLSGYMATGFSDTGSGIEDIEGHATNPLLQKTPPENAQTRNLNSLDDAHCNGLLGHEQGSQSNYYLFVFKYFLRLF